MSDEREYYGFTWPGKHEAMLEAGRPTDKVLRPCIEDSLNFDATENLYIEGDNLEALKVIQKSYIRRVKMIYIDPPYNTGHDFIYNDNFTQTEDEAREQFGLWDDIDVIRNFTMRHYRENSRSNPRYHSDWCSMMYPRLKIAQSLLSDDGVIFISIDDNEVTRLRMMCDEIFGESNFVAMFPWQARQSIQNDTDISCNHEYVVAYAANRRKENRRLKESNARTWFTEKSFACLPLPLDPDKFSNPDNDPRGAWKADPMDAPNIRPNLTYEIINPNTGERFLPPPGRCWRVNEKKYREWLADGRIVFGTTGETRPQVKTFYDEKKLYGTVDNTWWTAERCGTATQATKEQTDLFGISSPFDTPKPVKLMMQILRLVSRPGADDVILDFFSGSSTTAHAVMNLNAQDLGHRKFIMIQLPEECNPDSEAHKAGYATICDIGRERIKRAGSGLIGDTGFRVLKLDSTNYRDVFIPSDGLSHDLLDSLTDNLKPDRSPLDLLFGLVADFGLQLSLSYRAEHIDRFTIHVYGESEIVACFDDNITEDIITHIAQLTPSRIVLRDSGFTTTRDRINLEQLINYYAPESKLLVI